MKISHFAKDWRRGFTVRETHFIHLPAHSYTNSGAPAKGTTPPSHKPRKTAINGDSGSISTIPKPPKDTVCDTPSIQHDKLMRRPLMRHVEEILPENSMEIHPDSKAAVFQQSRRIQSARQRHGQDVDYTVLDLETTGLSHLRDHIIEIAALRVRNECIAERFHALVQCPIPLPLRVLELTGLSDLQLMAEGQQIGDVLRGCLEFIGSDLLVVHHAAFDYSFLQSRCKKLGLPPLKNQCMDTLKLARQKLSGLSSYSLEAISASFGFDVTGCHRAMKDCELTLGIYQKLKEI